MHHFLLVVIEFVLGYGKPALARRLANLRGGVTLAILLCPVLFLFGALLTWLAGLAIRDVQLAVNPQQGVVSLADWRPEVGYTSPTTNMQSWRGVSPLAGSP
jgi:hypothetical protein